MSLLVVGSVAFDSIRTPHGELADALGGSAVYFSLAARLFSPVRLVGVVGGDFADEHVALLDRHGVDTSGLERVPDGRTFRWAGEYSRDMNQRRTLSVEINVFENYEPKIPAPFRSSEFVFLANGTPVTQLSVLDQVEGSRFVMADTMDLWIETQRDDLCRLLKRIDGLLVNDSEALLLTGATNVVEAGRQIQAMGPRRVVIKKGEHGALLFDGDALIPFPAYPLARVLDPTGAGDSFAGAFMGYLASEQDPIASDPRRGGGKAAPDAADGLSTNRLKRAIAYGTVAASFTVEDFGVRSITAATPDAVRSRFEEFREFLEL